jgi:hypothetical protein
MVLKLCPSALRATQNFKRKKEKKQKKKKKRKPFREGLKEGNASFFQKKYYPKAQYSKTRKETETQRIMIGTQETRGWRFYLKNP